MKRRVSTLMHFDLWISNTRNGFADQHFAKRRFQKHLGITFCSAQQSYHQDVVKWFEKKYIAWPCLNLAKYDLLYTVKSQSFVSNLFGPLSICVGCKVKETSLPAWVPLDQWTCSRLWKDEQLPSGNLERFLNLLEFQHRPILYDILQSDDTCFCSGRPCKSLQYRNLFRSGWKVPHCQMVRTGFRNRALQCSCHQQYSQYSHNVTQLFAHLCFDIHISFHIRIFLQRVWAIFLFNVWKADLCERNFRPWLQEICPLSPLAGNPAQCLWVHMIVCTHLIKHMKIYKT